MVAERPTRERLTASLRHKTEAMSPRMLRRTLEELRARVQKTIDFLNTIPETAFEDAMHQVVGRLQSASGKG